MDRCRRHTRGDWSWGWDRLPTVSDEKLRIEFREVFSRAGAIEIVLEGFLQ